MWNDRSEPLKQESVFKAQVWEVECVSWIDEEMWRNGRENVDSDVEIRGMPIHSSTTGR